MISNEMLEMWKHKTKQEPSIEQFRVVPQNLGNKSSNR